MDQLMEVVDEGMKEKGYPIEEVLRIIHLALLCTQDSVDSRPVMSDVVAMLVSRVDVKPQTTIQPAFIDVAYKLREESQLLGLHPRNRIRLFQFPSPLADMFCPSNNAITRI
eukprot:Gb_05744 [translate_table: standard]